MSLWISAQESEVENRYSGGHLGGQYRPLDPEQIERIHQAALYILENIGFTYEQGLDDTLAMLEDAGAKIDRAHSRIYFPPDLILSQISKTPERVILYSRDAQNDIDLCGDRVYMGTGGMAVTVVDIETGQARKSCLQDIYNIGRIVDRLDNIHFYLRPCTAHDVPTSVYDVNCMYTAMQATTKHYMTGAIDRQSFRDMLALASIVAGDEKKLADKPIFSLITCFAISPLKLCTQSTLNMQEACRHRIPVALSSAPMAGSTSPMTMAGTLAQLHAEELVGLTIGQLTHPGAPMLYGGIPGSANMRTMGYQGGAVEFGMMNAAIHQLAAHINVPNYNSSGLTDAKIPDAQAGWEKAFSSLLAAMGGSNYIHHAAGMLESMLAVAYEQYIIDDEIIGMCTRVLEGIIVDDEHLAIEAIAEVGPGGNYLMSPHTLEHMRTEFFAGNGITDGRFRDTWVADGSLDTRERAQEMARKILENDSSSKIDKRTDKIIRDNFDIKT
ncbi:MAG: trimethylamine methyltransferase [Deltaproteobacteria bacterium]|nr:MAG: trimethylamine methyltransferase [Deltaproteobacteria bacterium]HHE75401.1 trimethylamine methyltransferase [Desulfobacteraceae bacterium]